VDRRVASIPVGGDARRPEGRLRGDGASRAPWSLRRCGALLVGIGGASRRARARHRSSRSRSQSSPTVTGARSGRCATGGGGRRA
jgi:hypothetical protein